jgi:chromate transporter
MEAEGLIVARDGKDRRVLPVLLAFLRLGFTSFGGPVAHIGYFREAFVARLRWLDEDRFAALLALCQLLPGPASSQLGMAVGHARAGWRGALAAWIGFTLPSALLMIAFAWGAGSFAEGTGWLHGLKLAAVAVVAQAVLLMARQFAADLPRAAIAIAAALAVALIGGAAMQAAVIVAGALLGSLLLAAGLPTRPLAVAMSRRVGLILLVCCFVLLVGMPLLGELLHLKALDQLATYLRAGALVFGGGHVVLPLLQEGVVASGAVGEDGFLAAYGAAQALPGPLFAVAAYPGFLGTPGGVFGALLAVIAIFLPGALLLFGMLPFWSRLGAFPRAGPALAGANAAVVGLLAAALWDPLVQSSILGPIDAVIALAAFAALWFARAPSLAVVIGCAYAGWLNGGGL